MNRHRAFNPPHDKIGFVKHAIMKDKVTQHEYNDETIIHFGKHKGKKLANVPDSWLRWYYGEHKHNLHHDPLVEYCYNNGLTDDDAQQKIW